MAQLNFTYPVFLGEQQIAEIEGRCEIIIWEGMGVVEDICLLNIVTGEYTACPGTEYRQFNPISSRDIESWLWQNRAEQIEALARQELPTRVNTERAA